MSFLSKIKLPFLLNLYSAKQIAADDIFIISSPERSPGKAIVLYLASALASALAKC